MLPHNPSRLIGYQLGQHLPFTAAGAVSGVLLMVAFSIFSLPAAYAEGLFWFFHPLHVLLSALVTTAMYRLHARGSWLELIFVGYTGSVGIATLSDSLIPYAGEWLLQFPKREVHLGFIEKWWLVNPLAGIGIAIGGVWPLTRFPHAGHMVLSTGASRVHMTMAMAGHPGWLVYMGVAVFLFLSVWIPCCLSDIVYPLLFARIVRPKET